MTLRWLAYYLPQFHPIPENDEWWGAGFTEWRNVARGRPRFAGHYQPHVPSDLGFYDLRLEETREAQADLARAYGIDGFVYYHYWFEGRRLLHRPLDDLLRSRTPDFPFALCWANENWSRRWDGGNEDVLVAQTYSPEDDLAHARWFLDVAADDRYVRIDGRPLFLIYHALDHPDPRRLTDTWRAEAARQGVPEPYFIRVESFAEERGDPTAFGFDASAEFQPDVYRMGPRVASSLVQRAWRKGVARDHPLRVNDVHSYGRIVDLGPDAADVDFKRYRCVMPGWDNTSRRTGRGARIVVDSTPALYERWVRSVRDEFTPYTPDENIAFVNAWNEWAEGNHLEPDLRWGRQYLEAHRRATESDVRTSPQTPRTS